MTGEKRTFFIPVAPPKVEFPHIVPVKFAVAMSYRGTLGTVNTSVHSLGNALLKGGLGRRRFTETVTNSGGDQTPNRKQNAF